MAGPVIGAEWIQIAAHLQANACLQQAVNQPQLHHGVVALLRLPRLGRRPLPAMTSCRRRPCPDPGLCLQRQELRSQLFIELLGCKLLSEATPSQTGNLAGRHGRAARSRPRRCCA